MKRVFCLAALCASTLVCAQAPTVPVMFVTQFPISRDFATIGSVFANHLTSMQAAGRGADLSIRYPDGTLKNLTASAGFGSATFQGANAISVRDPALRPIRPARALRKTRQRRFANCCCAGTAKSA